MTTPTVPVDISLAGDWDPLRPLTATLDGTPVDLANGVTDAPSFDNTTNVLSIHVSQASASAFWTQNGTAGSTLVVQYHLIGVDDTQTFSTMIYPVPLAIGARGCHLRLGNTLYRPVLSMGTDGTFESYHVRYADVDGDPPAAGVVGAADQRPVSGQTVFNYTQSADTVLQADLAALRSRVGAAEVNATRPLNDLAVNSTLDMGGHDVVGLPATPSTALSATSRDYVNTTRDGLDGSIATERGRIDALDAIASSWVAAQYDSHDAGAKSVGPHVAFSVPQYCPNIRGNSASFSAGIISPGVEGWYRTVCMVRIQAANAAAPATVECRIPGATGALAPLARSGVRTVTGETDIYIDSTNYLTNTGTLQVIVHVSGAPVVGPLVGSSLFVSRLA